MFICGELSKLTWSGPPDTRVLRPPCHHEHKRRFLSPPLLMGPRAGLIIAIGTKIVIYTYIYILITMGVPFAKIVCKLSEA